jgi:hypothetical protein
MKGQWKTMEAIIAGVIMLMFVAALNATTVQPAPQGPPGGHRVLKALDDMGVLRGPACGADTASVNSLAASTGYLGGFNHSVRICSASGGCAGQIPAEDNVWSYSYTLAGCDSYGPLEVVLYAFRS